MARFSILALFCGLALAACAAPEAPPEPDASTALTLAQGELVGYRAENGARVWRGLPFASPPVGELRWRAPRPHSGWEGRREALDPGPRCAQLTNALDAGEGLDPGLLIGSEDCLTLDVYAPAEAENAPVMVWIHGGGNVWGTKANYDGSNLAQEQGVVVVALQYRVGPLGWMAHPGLRDRAEIEADRAANFALLDQIAALDWVAENIAQFGGDPERVTIFGESAGGHNVAALIASPLAEGRFDRAILQSGSLETVSWEEASGQGGDYPNPGLEIAAEMAGGAADAEALRALPLEAVYAPFQAGERAGFVDLPTVIADGVSLPEDGIRGAFSRPGGFNAVPIITGTNRDEMKLFNFLDPRLVDRSFFGLHFSARDPLLYQTLSDYQGRQWRIGAVDEAAALLAEAGHDQVYAYRFDWDDGGTLLFSDIEFLLGAAHAMEIPFVFNRFEMFGPLDNALFRDQNAEDRAALAGAMGRYWASFAADGAPSGEGLPAWPVYGEGALMRLDSPEGGGLELITGVDSAARLAADLEQDDRLDDGQRCSVARAIDAFRGPQGDAYASRLGCASP